MSAQQYVVHHNGDTERFTDRDRFEEIVDLLEYKGEDYSVETPDAAGSHEKETDGGTAVVDNGSEQPAPENTETVEAEVVETADPLPKLSKTEEQARDVIQSLDQSDMFELVWNPHADSSEVPYNPRDLPYDSPTPSAEAFDLFASIIEACQPIQYSVEDVSFERDDEIISCTVEMVKRTPDGDKTLYGFKTRERANTSLDHHKERLYAKARRNALKADIPPTWISALLHRFREVQR